MCKKGAKQAKQLATKDYMSMGYASSWFLCQDQVEALYTGSEIIKGRKKVKGEGVQPNGTTLRKNVISRSNKDVKRI